MEEGNSSLLPPKTEMETMETKSGNLTGDFKVTNAIPRLRVPPVVSHVDGTNYGLPEGWTVEQKSRTSLKYFGIKDKTFLHRQTGKRFRSLVAAKKWIEENQDDQPHEAFQAAGVSKASQSSEPPLGSTRRKKAITKHMRFDFSHPPEYITWAFTDTENDGWSPYVGDTVVPDLVKNVWAETFLSVSFGNV